MEKCIWNSINKNVNKFMPKTKSKKKKNNVFSLFDSNSSDLNLQLND